MDAGSDHGSAAIGLTKDLEVTGSGPDCCYFSIPLFFAMCSFPTCLSFALPWYADYVHYIAASMET